MKQLYELGGKTGLGRAEAGRAARFSLLGLLALGLAGCGNYFSVRVPYQVPDSPNALAARRAMGGLYLVVKAQPQPEENALSGLAGALLNRPGPEFSPAQLAARAARALTRPGSRVCAWRVDKGGDPQDAFLGALYPTGLLVISAGRPGLSSKKEERSSVYYDKNKQKQTVKSKVWAYTASVSAGVKLLSVPEMAVLDAWADNFVYSEDRPDNSADAGDWYADNEEKLFSALSTRLVARYAGRIVDRFRPVFRKAKDKESEEAAKLAGQNRWPAAEEIWLRRAAAAGNWRDYFDLGVAAEIKKDYEGAAYYYKRAETRAAGDKEAKPVRWAEIYGDLELARATAPAAACGGTWFEVKTAVLPVTDETTSLDGPPLVRQLVYERLKESGYNLLTLEETDELLRRRGFSDGGQLAATKPEELARWLGAGRLLYVHLTDFGEIMAGVYNRRMVKGSARVWEAGRPDYLFEESVVKVKTPKNFVFGLFGQLAKGIAERIKNKPLAYESGLFSGQVTEGLPNSVKK